MTNSRKKVTNPDAPAKKTTKGAEPPAPPWALIPSAEQLRQAVGAAMYMNAGHEGKTYDHVASLDVPRTLLNPLDSLPRPLTRDEVKKRVRFLPTTSMKQSE